MESLSGAFRVGLWARCRQVAEEAGALSVLTRHSSSRKTMSMTQCKEFSMAQWAQIIGPTGGGQQHQRGDVEARLVGGASFRPRNGAQARPLMVLLQPGDIVDHGVASSFDTAVIAVDGFVRSDRGILVFQGFLLIDKDLDILARGALIPLQRQDVIGLFLDDLCGDVALAAHRIDRHHRALDRHHVEQRPNGKAPP
jgi:hypothetical protein